MRSDHGLEKEISILTPYTYKYNPPTPKFITVYTHFHEYIHPRQHINSYLSPSYIHRQPPQQRFLGYPHFSSSLVHIRSQLYQDHNQRVYISFRIKTDQFSFSFTAIFTNYNCLRIQKRLTSIACF